MDAQQAKEVQSDYLRSVNLQAHDHEMAHWLDNIPEQTWANHGANLERPVEPASLQGNIFQGTLTFGGYVHGHMAGFAAVLTNDAGMENSYTRCNLAESLHSFQIFHSFLSEVVVWEGSDRASGNIPATMIIAQMQGLHMGLLAAQHLGFKDLQILIPADYGLLQVCLMLMHHAHP